MIGQGEGQGPGGGGVGIMKGVCARRKGGSARVGGCTLGIVSNRRVHVHTSIWHIDKAS